MTGVFFLLFYFIFVRVKGLIAPFFQPALCQGVPRCVNRLAVHKWPNHKQNKKRHPPKTFAFGEDFFHSFRVENIKESS